MTGRNRNSDEFKPGSFGREQTTSEGIQGVVVGTVTDNKDPQNEGRVKVEFQERDIDDETDWVRIAKEMTGPGYGTYFIPDVGREVLVAFKNGDIHKPFVIGTLWNGKEQTPRDQKKDKKNEIREIQTRSNHRLTFVDKDKEKNKEGSVTIETRCGNEIIIDDSKDRETIILRDAKKKNKIILDSRKGTIDIKSVEQINLTSKNVNIKAKQNVSIQANQKVDISSKGQVNITAKQKLSTQSNGLMKHNATGALSIKGSIIRLN